MHGLSLLLLITAFVASSKILPLKAKHKNRVLFKIEVGKSKREVGYQIEPEVEPWGPSSFVISPEGKFYLNDGVNREIDFFKINGK